MSEQFDYEAFWMSKIVDLDESKQANGKRRGEVQLLRTGSWYHPTAPGKRLDITETLLDEIEANFNSGIRGKELPTNEDHADKNCSRSPAWIVGMKRQKGALYGTLEFADDAFADDVKKGKIKYMSPELQFGYQNPEDGKKYNVMKAAAFTNFPYLKNMDPVQILNLSEMASQDSTLVALNCYRQFSKVMDALSGDLEDAGCSVSTWQIGDLKDKFKMTDKDLPRDVLLDKGTALFSDITEVFRSLSDEPKSRAIAMRHQADAEDAVKKLLVEKGISLSEVNLAAMPPEEDPRDGVTPDDTDGDGVQDGSPLTDATDPDAQSKDLPMQCMSCSRLSDGSCPFQGIEIKLAAASEGNCPQYMSKQAEASDSDPDIPTEDGEAPAQQAVPRTNLSEGGKQMDEQAVKAQLEDLATRLKSVEASNGSKDTEIADLKSRLNLSETEKNTDRRNAWTTRHIEEGRITPAQSKIYLSICEIGDGATDVKLSDGETEATIETLLAEFIELIEPNTPLSETGTNPVGKVDNRPGDANTSDHERRMPKYEARAKEKAATSGGEWKTYLSESMREVNLEMKEARN